MSQPIPPQEVSPDDVQEIIRAVQICLTGTEVPAKLTWRMGLFDAWANRVFIGRIAPHLLTVRAAADAGDMAAVLAADNALAGGENGLTAGRAWLGRQRGAKHANLLPHLASALGAGKAAGEFHTVLALQSANFHVGHLPMLQAALYCEWRAARPDERSTLSVEEFLRRTRSIMSQLPALVSAHVLTPPIAAAGR
ncbi:MAG: hypothetical protein V4726_09545 [Verrucomicrobiota bacterium]